MELSMLDLEYAYDKVWLVEWTQNYMEQYLRN